MCFEDGVQTKAQSILILLSQILLIVLKYLIEYYDGCKFLFHGKLEFFHSPYTSNAFGWNGISSSTHSNVFKHNSDTLSHILSV